MAFGESFARGVAAADNSGTQRNALALLGLDLQREQATAATASAQFDRGFKIHKSLVDSLDKIVAEVQAKKTANPDFVVPENTLNVIRQTGERIDRLAGVIGAPTGSAEGALSRLALAPDNVAAKVREQQALLPGNVEEAEQTAIAEQGVKEQGSAARIAEAKQIAKDKAEIDAAQKRLDEGRFKPSDIKGLRGDFTTLSKPFIGVRDAFSRIQQIPDNAEGDLGLIFSIMKMFDPQSVVREGEFATAENTAGVDQRVRNTYNRIRSGERLSPDQRANFRGIAKDLFAAAQSTQLGLEERFRGIAERHKVNPDDVLVIDAAEPPARATVPIPPTGREGTFTRRGKINGVMMDVFQAPDGTFFGVESNGG